MFKVITKANQNKGKYHKEPIRTQKSGEGEKQENWLRFTFRFSVIGFEGGESFLDQSQSKVKQNQKQSWISYDTLFWLFIVFEVEVCAYNLIYLLSVSGERNKLNWKFMAGLFKNEFISWKKYKKFVSCNFPIISINLDWFSSF